MRLIWSLLLLVTGLLGQNTTSANEITVRVIDIRSAQGIANEEVNVQFHVVGNSELQRLDGKTGIDGRAKFHLPDPVPPTVSVMASQRLYPCYSLLQIETVRLLRDGMLSRCSKPSQGCSCKFSTQVLKVQYTPGELILPVRPFTSWEKFLMHIWE